MTSLLKKKLPPIHYGVALPTTAFRIGELFILVSGVAADDGIYRCSDLSPVTWVLERESLTQFPAGTVTAPGVTFQGQTDIGLYLKAAAILALAVAGAEVAEFDASGLKAASVRHLTNLGTPGAATVSLVEYGDGRDVTTVLTLTNFIVGAPGAAAASKGIGNKVYSFPAGVHVHSVSYINLGFTCAGTNKTPKVGLGSVIASGVVAVLNGTATFMDYLTEQTASDTAGTAAPFGPLGATAGLMAGISLNKAADVKDVFLNAAAAWAANNTGNLTASGVIVLRWTKLA